MFSTIEIWVNAFWLKKFFMKICFYYYRINKLKVLKIEKYLRRFLIWNELFNPVIANVVINTDFVRAWRRMPVESFLPGEEKKVEKD